MASHSNILAWEILLTEEPDHGVAESWALLSNWAHKPIPTQFDCNLIIQIWVQFSSVAQPWPGPHARPPCPSPTPGVYANSCPSSQWWHPAISSCRPLFILPPILPSIRVLSTESIIHMRWPKYWSFSFSIILPKNTRDWSPLGWTSWISLESKELSRIFSNTTVQKHQFFSIQLSSQSNFHIHT